MDPSLGGPGPEEVTGLLRAAEAGDRDALDRVFSVLYGELRAIAHRQLQGAPAERTLSTTALVHEAYLKLNGVELDVSQRGPFLALAAKAMRCVLVDHARARGASKRGGDQARVTLATDLVAAASDSCVDVLDIERSLQSLETLDPRLARVVELHFYAGMEFEEIAEHLGVAARTVYRDWRKARAFLLTQLGAVP